MTRTFFPRWTPALFLLSLAATPAFARFEPVTCANNPFTQQQEVEEGNKVALQVYQQMPVLPDSDPISRYIQSLGARLEQRAPVLPGVQRQWPFNFHVVASSEINAFALPGGSMFVNLGAIQAAQSEAQLAGVMAHEMSHVIMRHSTCNLKRQQNKGLLYGLGQIGAAILLKDSAAGQVAQTGLGIGQSLDFLHMSRGDEEQADLLGVNLLEQANYDPRGLPQFFEIIAAKSGSGGAQFLSDHPNPGNRTQYTMDEIATLPALDRPTVRTAAFDQAHAFAAQRPTLTAEQTKAGAWKQSGRYASSPGDQGNPQQAQYPSQQYPNQQDSNRQYPNPQDPSRQYPNQQDPNRQYPNQQDSNQQDSNRQYSDQQRQRQRDANANQAAQQPVIAPLTRARLGFRDRMNPYQAERWSIRVPSSWRVVPPQPTNRPQDPNSTPDVTLAPAGGAGNFGVAYGVVIGIEEQDAEGVSDAQDLARAAAPILQRYLRNSGLTQTGSVTQTQIAGKAALTVQLSGTSPVGNARGHVAETDLLVLIVRPDGDISSLIFVAPQQDYNTLLPTFNAMLQSFSPQ